MVSRKNLCKLLYFTISCKLLPEYLFLTLFLCQSTTPTIILIVILSRLETFHKQKFYTHADVYPCSYRLFSRIFQILLWHEFSFTDMGARTHTDKIWDKILKFNLKSCSIYFVRCVYVYKHLFYTISNNPFNAIRDK